MPETIFCSKCGASLDAQARFCIKCGATITPTAVSSAPLQPYPHAAAAPAPAQYGAPTQPSPYGNVPQYGAMPPVPQPYGAMPTAPPQYGAAAQPYSAAPYAAVSPYAGFWMRVGAYILDFLILSIPFTMLVFALFIFAWPLLIVGVWLYFALQESSVHQATLGKRALNIYVTDMYGRRITFGQATGRYFGKILSGILCIGYIMVAFTERKQGLHDLLAGTLVLRRY